MDDDDFEVYMTVFMDIGTTWWLRQQIAGFQRGDTFVYFGDVDGQLRLYSFRRDETFLINLPKHFFDPIGFSDPSKCKKVVGCLKPISSKAKAWYSYVDAIIGDCR